MSLNSFLDYIGNHIIIELIGQGKKMTQLVSVSDGENVASVALRSFKEMTDHSYSIMDEITIEMVSEDGGRVDIVPFTSDTNVVFSALRSNRKILRMSELNLPEPEALSPAPLDYGPENTKGWAEIQEQIAFAQAIRHLAIPPHPYKTHIEYFVHKIPVHIKHIEKGILERNDLSEEQIQTAKQMLKDLKQEASRAIRQKQVSYVWWFNFNALLTDVANGRMVSSENPTHDFQSLLKSMNVALVTHTDIEVIEFFPFRMILPAIGGKLGIMTLNTALAHEVWPVGLVIKVTEADGDEMNPKIFALHDVFHATGITADFTPRSTVKDILSVVRDSLSGPERARIEDTIFNRLQ